MSILQERFFKGLSVSLIITGVLTFLWVIIMITVNSIAPADTIAEKLTRIEEQPFLYYSNYALAVLITLFTLFVFSGFSHIINKFRKKLAGINLALAALYGLGNMMAYLTQIILVPFLSGSEKVSDEKMLQTGKLLMQDVSYSLVSYMNLAAYAALGIASMIAAHYINRLNKKLKIPAILLSLSGFLSIVAFGGILFRSQLIQSATLLSGGIYMISVLWLGIIFYKNKKEFSNE